MYGLYLAIVRHKDHLLFILALTLSLLLILNNTSPEMGVVRGKAAEVVSFMSSPITFIRSLMFLENETQILRKKNLELSLQVESMLNLQVENDELLSMLDLKKRTKLIMKPARVVNKGLQPNLLSIVITTLPLRRVTVMIVLASLVISLALVLTLKILKL